ncbi:hypothetical protein OVA03_04490 [Asticcacaulis sp. SL142]|jgi:ABC-type uncharacterized transport system YnjBCD permease subunit|uniref:hypothetical protein n=1 Tax=Asticcacaulis sp. SL142 TaxID=2995155 RepID=UPI00226C729E|nr:hypothetical protein [Asticcacaulis sp. SL142]WAC49179.1 hypothetical protein OVA03_04490 [Asticcacaulis sp. SL142]
MSRVTIDMPDVRRELSLFAVCFALAFALNVYAIFAFHTSWRELITSLPWVMAITVFLYGIAAIVRLLIYAFKRLQNRLITQKNNREKSS